MSAPIQRMHALHNNSDKEILQGPRSLQADPHLAAFHLAVQVLCAPASSSRQDGSPGGWLDRHCVGWLCGSVPERVTHRLGVLWLGGRRQQREHLAYKRTASPSCLRGRPFDMLLRKWLCGGGEVGEQLRSREDELAADERPAPTGQRRESSRVTSAAVTPESGDLPEAPDETMSVSLPDLDGLTDLGRQKLCEVGKHYLTDLMQIARETRKEIGAEDIENARTFYRLRGSLDNRPDATAVGMRAIALAAGLVSGIFAAIAADAASRYWSLPVCVLLIALAVQLTVWDLNRRRR